MKYLQFILALLLVFTCSSTKGVVEYVPKKTVEAQKKIEEDTLAQKIEIEKTISDDIDKKNTPIEHKENSPETPKEFNQTLTKRFIETHQLWDELLQKHVSKTGNVNYKNFKTEHKKLLDYINVLNLIHGHESFQSLSKEEKLAYWINAYNALTVDLILRHYPVKSIKDIKNPWDQRLWKLGNKWYNLNDIEHQILRKMNEPRIHFAIVCASFSCPKLHNQAFEASMIEEQLSTATVEFLSDTNRNEISENSLKISKIFDWFSKDFKQNGSLINFINQYSDINISAKAKINFKDYNWSLNE